MNVDVSRVKNVSRTAFKFEVVTPMFTGGADPACAEIRAQSIKGLLRFWWRVFQSEPDIKKLKEEENRIFGSTKGKSRFSIAVSCQEKPRMEDLNKGETYSVAGKSFSPGIIEYLAFGVCSYNSEQRKFVYLREHFTPESKFELHFTFYDDSIKNEVLKSLALLVCYGGIGAKSRNGFGSVRLLEGELPDVGTIQPSHNLLPYPSFSKSTRLIEFKTQAPWVSALSEIGMAYRSMRISKKIGIEKHVFRNRELLARPIIDRNREVAGGRLGKQFYLHVDRVEDGWRGKILIMPYAVHGGEKNETYRTIIADAVKILEDYKNNKKPETIY
ncbi:MAG TPA: type III-B CRISPR module RAMP protein Cmr1 [Spirochaetota bacterium]|nr:type III-B CRISPR module RAMP protein Cmr1 [Spirochaetota bacterium]